MSLIFTINEDGGAINFEIRVLNGILRINVGVLFRTADDSAHGMQVCFMLE